MARHGKKYLTALKSIESRPYALTEAIETLKKVRYERFDATFELSVDLNIDPRQANQLVRGTVSLPHGTGRSVRVLALVAPDKEKDALNAGADYAGLDEYIPKIEQGWLDFDAVVCTPDVMPKVARLGKILGPRGLMPNPKSGTVTPDITRAIKELKAGKIEIRNDKTGVVHLPIGKASFDTQKLRENAIEALKAIESLRPAGVKGTYILSAYISTTMSPAILLDRNRL
ncbi:MAG: 50S ribosomal protein L1 [Bacteroidia bacterium]|nr:50S ribosomal protein L1 [Bacteroidia bacterium]MCX7652264.1 50S ribosomal protein L1 [Bacteroidia bacterium]MDW8416526.1 50S ribosomal protein L1 [Bacteroidia bacterium]